MKENVNNYLSIRLVAKNVLETLNTLDCLFPIRGTLTINSTLLASAAWQNKTFLEAQCKSLDRQRQVSGY